jgi:hypothetical protein
MLEVAPAEHRLTARYSAVAGNKAAPCSFTRRQHLPRARALPLLRTVPLNPLRQRPPLHPARPPMHQAFRVQLVSGDPSPEELAGRFADLASSESHCSSAKRGGDLGHFG